jgi:hypothetical protein
MHWPASNLSIGILSRLIEAEKARAGGEECVPYDGEWFSVWREWERVRPLIAEMNEYVRAALHFWLHYALITPRWWQWSPLGYSFRLIVRAAGIMLAVSSAPIVRRPARFIMRQFVWCAPREKRSLLSCLQAGFELFDAITFSLCCGATHSQRSLNLLPRNTLALKCFLCWRCTIKTEEF